MKKQGKMFICVETVADAKRSGMCYLDLDENFNGTPIDDRCCTCIKY